jgi:hypothetical protein
LQTLERRNPSYPVRKIAVPQPGNSPTGTKAAGTPADKTAIPSNAIDDLTEALTFLLRGNRSSNE